jgi:2TM domain
MRVSAPMATNDLKEPGSEREQALQRLKKKRDLQGHLVTYLIVNVAVWVIWAATGAGYPWPAWVTGGWGLAVLLNVWDVYGRSPITEADVEREMRRLHAGH